MAVNDSILKENKIKFVCVGKVNESALELKENVEVRIGKREENKTVKCKQIGGKVSIDTGNGIVTFFPTFDEIGYDGEQSRQWTMAMAMLDWNPKIKGDSNKEVTRVMLTGTLNYYDGYMRDSNKTELKKSYRVSGASTNVPDTLEDGFSFEGNFFITSTDINEDTGEGKIKMGYSNYRGEFLPVECTVDPDDVELVLNTDASDWESIKPVQSRYIKVSYFRVPDENAPVQEEVKGHSFGKKYGKTPDVPVYSKHTDKYVLTYTRDYPVAEPEKDDDGNYVVDSTDYYNPVAVRAAIKARNQKIEEMEKNPPAKKSAPATGTNALRQAKANNAFGSASKAKATSAASFFEDLDSDLDLPF